MRHFLCLNDLGADGIITQLDRADQFKKTRGTTGAGRPLAGKSVALIFEKASTRTRLSLEVAVAELGGHPVVLTSAGSQLGRGEPISDTAKVLTRMVHAVTVRTFGQERVAELAQHCSIPVLNALTDLYHPMQLLADLQTVRAVKGTLKGLKYAWIGDGNNKANSWIEAAGLLGLDLTVACPAGFDPDAATLREAIARGGRIQIVRDPKIAAQSAHVISTDVWASMGQEAEQAARAATFKGMGVTQALLDLATKDVVVLHCLPAHRGEEIDADVIDGPRSFVWDQAEARLHTSKAVLTWAMGLDGSNAG
ncbi:MAG TPA: ornithine carbamoyltransferase [Polyangiaceae bacterium]|nr:ornithine carbamoyltransferase [Polyangiaceae bacterium]